MKTLASDSLIFIDESGTNAAMAREYGRALAGKRSEGARPCNFGGPITMIGALKLEGVAAIMTVNGGTDTAVFTAFVEQLLLPILTENSVVILDNLGAHKAEAIRKLVIAAGAKFMFLPPYSPDLNPIEECWSKMKAIMRKLAARTRETIDSAVAAAADAVTTKDCVGWFTHSGYLQSTR
jgi:transposase